MKDSMPLYKQDAEAAALLGDKAEARSSTSSITLSGDSEGFSAAKPRRSYLLISIVIHLILALVSVGSLAVILGLESDQCVHGPDVIYSPAREAVYYEPRFMNNSLQEDNQFKGGHPTHEQTLAWREMLHYQIVVLQKEDLIQLGQLNENSVQFADGSGYLGALDMYHELHCLNYIREYIHRDFYEMTEVPEVQIIHVDHCIETLRQIIVCHADTSIVTYDWIDDRELPMPNFAITRECRNWDHMNDYIMTHQPDRGNGPLFVHPKYGAVPWQGHKEGSPLAMM